ncbi:MAG: HAD family hydrolase [Desulfovibrio sp.]|nr:HAD family hydrolase [Desulfovibrio sp.]
MGKGFIFDLDGTILDTRDDIGNACNKALEAFGYPTHPLEEYQQMVGNGFIVLIMRALPKGESERLSEESFNAIFTAAKKAYASHMTLHTLPYKNIPETLQALAKRGSPLSVLSNKPEELTQKLIAHYFPSVPFALVLGGRDDKPLKPDPTRAKELLSTLGLNPHDTYFVGDSQVDMLTAKNAGMIPVGVSWGFRGPEEVEAHGAVHILRSATDLLSLP